MLFTILTATTISGLLSLVGAFLLAQRGKWEETFSLQLTAFASGVMLTTALLHLAPEALHEGIAVEALFQTMLVGIVAFFVFERSVLWFHHHHESHGPKPSAWLIMVGDSIHNVIDGVAIASAFLINPTLGIVTTLAVSVHEIPQEIADFVTMIRGGMTSKRALLWNMVSAVASIIGALLAFIFRESLEPIIPFVLAFSAGMFLYIALSDLIPELHHHTKENTEKWKQLLWLFCGIGLMFGVTSMVESLVPHGDVHDEEELHVESDHEEDVEVVR